MGKLIIDGNSVYTVDEECLKRRQVPDTCGVQEALNRQEDQERKYTQERNRGKRRIANFR